MDQLQARLEAFEPQMHTAAVHTVTGGSAGGGAWPAAWSGWRCSPGCCRPSSRKKTPLTKARRGWRSGWRPWRSS